MFHKFRRGLRVLSNGLLSLFSPKPTQQNQDQRNENTVSRRKSAKGSSKFDFNDSWKSRYQNIPLRFFGHGCTTDFSSYLKQDSQVQVGGLNDILDWLLGCQYVSDPSTQGVRDHWQHPVEFEQTRQGDCEDFALWAWRKLLELGYHAEFTVGKWIHEGRIGTHAWVVFDYQDEVFILESTGSNRERMLKPVSQVMTEYVPFAAIDKDLKKKVYNGIANWILAMSKRTLPRP